MNLRKWELLLSVFVFFGISFAADPSIDENELFADTTTLSRQKDLVDSSKVHVQDATERKTTTISGDITAAATGVALRDYMHGHHVTDTYLASLLVGNILLDARLLNNVKAFANCEADYSASSDTIGVSLREMFIDANISKQVYFRAGKQVLQWGRCFLWNPTDLINVEKKPFIEKIGAREGTYGLRVHAPFGTKVNAYSFVNLQGVDRADKIAGTVKLEFLTGGTEMAVSLWGKNNRPPVAGYDFSTQAFDINIYGEASISNGSNTPKMKEKNGILSIDTAMTGWNPRVSLGASRFFDFFDIHDGITVGVEAFYNGDGYKDNIFRDNKYYKFHDSVTFFVPKGPSMKLGMGDKKTFLLANNLWDPNYHSQYYVAVFTGISRFLLSDLALNLNAIANVEQGCGILSGSFSYTTLSNLTLGITIDGYLGGENTEYTFSKSAMDVRVTARLAF
jgi:hypothetical protein